MEKLKKKWRPGTLDDSPKTPEELQERIRDMLEYLDEEIAKAEKKAKEGARK